MGCEIPTFDPNPLLLFVFISVQKKSKIEKKILLFNFFKMPMCLVQN